METTAANPLARFALGIPAQTARAMSVAGRIFGAGLAIAVAFDQSYDPTQVFTGIVAALVLMTLLPVRGAPGDVGAALGAGLVFFAGTLLTHMGFGLAMLAVGAFALVGALVFAHREGRDTTLPAVAFMAAVFLVAALQVGVVFSFE
jgi:hypothetical protein